MTNVLDELLFPLSAQTFMEQYWKKEPLLLQERSGDAFTPYFNLGDFEKLVATLQLDKLDSFSLIKSGESLSSNLVNSDGMVDWADIFSAYGQGYTFILNKMKRYIPSLKTLFFQLGEIFKSQVDGNLYLTPKGAQGLAPHFDRHHVMVIQIEGTKHWKIYQHFQQLPLKENQTLMPLVIPPEILEAPSMSFELKPGDLLYLPHGFIHEASSGGDDFSLHLSIGIYLFPWMELGASIFLNTYAQQFRR